MEYQFTPNLIDEVDPKVIEGYPIKRGSVVEITKRKIDPYNMFVFLQDNFGNRQSVYKNSLTAV